MQLYSEEVIDQNMRTQRVDTAVRRKETSGHADNISLGSDVAICSPTNRGAARVIQYLILHRRTFRGVPNPHASVQVIDKVVLHHSIRCRHTQLRLAECCSQCQLQRPNAQSSMRLLCGRTSLLFRLRDQSTSRSHP
jgi:hypothetical protein